MAHDLADAIEDRSAHGIAAGIGRHITSGALPTGSRLPTVRALAAALEVSPTTVSEAWRILAAVGAIEAKGRNGTFVREPPGPGAAQRYRQVTEGPGRFDLDLSTGTPDLSLLPDLAPIVARVSTQDLTSSYLDPPVLPALEEQLRQTWPFAPESLTVVDGAMDAIDRVARSVVRLGDRVIVEHPTFPPVLDLLEQLGAEVIGVAVDVEGPVLAELTAALAQQPTLLVLQPRAQNPTGSSLSTSRARAIARAVARTDCIVVEDDHSGEIATSELVSVGRWQPSRVVHIRSFSKSHGPDLRLAAIGGAGDVVDAVAARRLIGPGWTSRILQAVLVALLADPAANEAVARARHAYGDRRARFGDELRALGIDPTIGDGINAWIPVADEQGALVSLAANGIGAAPGTPFYVRPEPAHLRLTIGLLRDGAAVEAVASSLAASALADGWSHRRR